MVEKVYKIKDVFNLFAGGDVNHSHFSEYKTSAYIFCVYSNSLADHGLYGYTDVPKYSGDSITITGRGSIGHAEYRPFDFDAIIRLLVLIPKYKDIIDSRYVTELINSYVKFPLESTGVPQLTVPQIENIEISLPTIEVQRKIANALSDMDSMISSLEKLIAKYKSIKTACLQQMFPQNGETVPRMRLPGFTDDWEQRKAIDIADYSKGNGYSKGDLTDAGTPIILYGRLYTKYQFAISEVDTFAFPRNGAVYSQGNEVIVPASGETAEDIARASAVEKSGVLLGGDLNILRPFDFINPLFLALAISNGEPQKELAKKAQGKSVVHIHNTDIQEVTIAYPSRTEQDRIVSVFRQLDNLITLHQRKLKKVQKIKQGMMQQLLTGKIRLV